MKNSTLGAIMQKTFAKSVTGCGIILDQDNDSWWDEISSIPPASSAARKTAASSFVTGKTAVNTLRKQPLTGRIP